MFRTKRRIAAGLLLTITIIGGTTWRLQFDDEQGTLAAQQSEKIAPPATPLKREIQKFDRQLKNVKASLAQQMLAKHLGHDDEQDVDKPMILVEDRSNTIYVRGPAFLIDSAKKFLDELDKIPPLRLTGDSQYLKSHSAPGKAEPLATQLLEMPAFKDRKDLRINAVGRTEIQVWAAEGDQVEIAKQLTRLIALDIEVAYREAELAKAKGHPTVSLDEPPLPTVPWANRLFAPVNTPPVIVHDFGTVEYGMLLTHRFQFTNIYSVPLQITKDPQTAMFPGRIVRYTKELPAQSSGFIEIELDSRQIQGQKSYSIWVRFGPDFQSTAVLQVRAFGKPSSTVKFDPKNKKDLEAKLKEAEERLSKLVDSGNAGKPHWEQARLDVANARIAVELWHIIEIRENELNRIRETAKANEDDVKRATENLEAAKKRLAEWK
jgi:hypothetical protein